MPDAAPPITLRQLRYLAALEEAGHFRIAAERCGISQPSLSAQIKSLEETLGLLLVERGRGPVKLTAAGREVNRRGREMLDAAQAIMELSVTLKTDLGGTLKLGTSATIGPYLMPNVVSDLHRRHPDLRLYVREAAPVDLLVQLKDGAHDLILTQLPATGAGLTTERLFREPLALAMSKEHPLTRATVVEGPELEGETILSLSHSYTLHDQIAAICAETGAQISRDYEGTSLDALRQMVAMDMGLTFLPALYVRSEIEGRANDVVVRPFRGRRFARSIGLVWRTASGSNETARRLAGAIRETARRFPELVIEAPNTA